MNPFSILERIVVGETKGSQLWMTDDGSFSILERIVVGETIQSFRVILRSISLSVSSNGSLWVKLSSSTSIYSSGIVFQYPRTDRCG